MVGLPYALAAGREAAGRMTSVRAEPPEAMVAGVQQSADAALSREAEAQSIRLQVVEFASTQFGPSLLNDWNHPSTTWPTQADTFVMAYVKLMMMEQTLERPDDLAAPKIKGSPTSASGAFRFLSRALGGGLGPAGDVLGSVGSAASRVPESEKVPSNVYEAHLREVQAVAHEVLSPADYQAYVHAAETGDYAMQTSLLFTMDYEVFHRQPVVNPYVLWWCDMRGSDGRAGTRPLYDFPEIAPGDDRFKAAAWNGFTSVQRWEAVDDGLKQWFQRTSVALADPAQRVTLLASVKVQKEEKKRRGAFGPDAAEVNIDLVSALGSEALAKYNHGSPEERATLLKTATLFVEGLNSLLPMLMGVPSLTVEGTVAPLVGRP